MKCLDNVRLWLNVFLIVTSCHTRMSQISTTKQPEMQSEDLNDADVHKDRRIDGYPLPSSASTNEAHFLGLKLMVRCHACYSCVGRCMVDKSSDDARNTTMLIPNSWNDGGFMLVEDKNMLRKSKQCKWACWCDIRCTIYGDCCYDFYNACLKLNDKDTTGLIDRNFQVYDGRAVTGDLFDLPELCERIPEHISPFQSGLSVRACLSSINVRISESSLKRKNYYVISRCPSQWMDADIRSACESNSMNYVHNIHVNDPVHTGIVFKNMFCALCHERIISRSDFWMARVSCPKEYLDYVTKTATDKTNTSNFILSSSLCELFVKTQRHSFLRHDYKFNSNYVRISHERKVSHESNSTSFISLVSAKQACYFYRLPVHPLLHIDVVYANPHCAIYHDVQRYKCDDWITEDRVSWRSGGHSISLPLLFSFQESNIKNMHASYENIQLDISDSSDRSAGCLRGDVYNLSSQSCEMLPCSPGEHRLPDSACEQVDGDVTQSNETLNLNQTLPLLIQFDAVLLVDRIHFNNCIISLSQSNFMLLLLPSLCPEHEASDKSCGNQTRNPISERSKFQSNYTVSQFTINSDFCRRTIGLSNVTINSNNRSGVNISEMFNIMSHWKSGNRSMAVEPTIDTTIYGAYPETYIQMSGHLLHMNNSEKHMNNICMFPVHVRLAMTIPAEDNKIVSEFISKLVNYGLAVNAVRMLARENILVIEDISIQSGLKCNISDPELQVQVERKNIKDITLSYVSTLITSQGFAFKTRGFSNSHVDIIRCRHVYATLWERQFGKCKGTLRNTDHFKIEGKYVYFNILKDSYRTDTFLLLKRTLTFCSSVLEKRFSTLNNYVTVIGFSFSIICLVLIFITYCMFPTLRNVPGLIVMSLSPTLAIAMLLFLVGVNQTDIPWVCVTIASILHFLWLSVFLWMSALSFDLCRVFSSKTKPSNQYRSWLIYKYAAFAICLPIGTVSCALITGFISRSKEGNLHSVYGNALFCWIRNPRLNLYWFGIPIAISQAFNLCFFVKSVHSICIQKKQSSMVNNSRGKIFDILLYFKLSLIMGITWLLFFLSSPDPSNVLFSISTIVNSLNGVFLFIVFVCKRRIFRLFTRRFASYKVTRSRASSSTGILSKTISLN